MNATSTPTYQVRISHPSGITQDQIQAILADSTTLQDLCLEQAVISSGQLYALGYPTDEVQVGLVTPDDGGEEALVLFVAVVEIHDDITAMNLLDSIRENTCEHTKVSIRPTDEKGLSEIDLTTNNTDTDERDD